MKFEVTSIQKEALEAACEAFVPALQPPENGDPQYWASTAKDFNVAAQILEIMASQSPAEQADFRQLLDLLNSNAAGWCFSGKWMAFRAMPLDHRVKVLRKWRDSRINLLRKAFGTLKKLTLFLHYGSHQENQHPAWKVNGYPGARNTTPGPKARIHPITITEPQEWTCDAVIVGSGAGGGLAAGRLAEAGWDVVVLEKGPFLTGEDFTDHEVEMIRKTYDKQGAFATRDGGMTIFAGSCLGGGTTINWTGAFRTPEYVLEEWARDHGLPFAINGDFHQSLDRVWADVGVNTANSPHNPQNQALWRASGKLGEHVEVIARNVEGCAHASAAQAQSVEAGHASGHEANGTESCGYCGLGCRRGNKRGTLATYLQRAADKGARMVVGAEVSTVQYQGNQATGVTAQIRQPDGSTVSLKVKARVVVMAAGSIHTPAILMRSGWSHPGLGRNLFLHPTVGVTGLYAEPMRPWLGTMMSAVNKAHIRLDGNYGFWVETPPVHPGVGAMALAWEGPAQHKQDLTKAAHLGSFIVLTRDRFGGRVRVDSAGWPVVDYRLSGYDRRHMFLGLRKAFELHRAAGAEQVTFPHVTKRTYKYQATKIAPEAWLRQMPRWGWKANQFALFTAHQMGGCAMGSGTGRHPVDMSGQLRGLRGVYVADGSLLPTSAGINPMMTIMALADVVVNNLIAGR